jgi:RNA polymerase sigma-70 factor (ECF subfamily)
MLSEQAVQTLIENRRAFVSFLEHRLGGRRELAEDVLQDAFAKSLDKAPAAADEQSVVSWFYAVLRNAVIDAHRRGTTRDKAVDARARELEAEPEPAPDMRNAVCKCVAKLSGTLKPEYADAINRIDVEEQSIQEFADAEGITPNNARVRVFRAREALRKRVLRSCGKCAEHGCVDCTCKHD